MSIKPEQIIDLAEAEQYFCRTTQIADKFGTAYICIDDRPKYILIDVESSYNIEMTDDEKALLDTVDLLTSKPVIYACNMSEEDFASKIESNARYNAVKALAEILGIKEDNVGAIGDYYNDTDMLLSVKHSACPSQAPEDIQKICEYRACHCNDGAVADFLSYIENSY